MNKVEDLPLIIEVSLAILSLFGVILLIAVIFRYLSFWNRIERLYRVKEKPNLYLNTHMESIIIETPIDPSGFLTRFSRMISIGATESGVYLAPLFLIGFVMHPVLIPWSDIAMTGFGRFEISLLKLPNVTILLRPEMARDLIEHFESGYTRDVLT